MNILKISKQDAIEIGFGLYELLKDFYLNPENERKIQEWLKKKARI